MNPVGDTKRLKIVVDATPDVIRGRKKNIRKKFFVPFLTTPEFNNEDSINAIPICIGTVIAANLNVLLNALPSAIVSAYSLLNILVQLSNPTHSKFDGLPLYKDRTRAKIIAVVENSSTTSNNGERKDQPVTVSNTIVFLLYLLYLNFEYSFCCLFIVFSDISFIFSFSTFTIIRNWGI